MKLFKRAADLQEHISRAKQSGLKVAFVPTMGALHDGHLSLIREAAKDNALVVVSIFVNPTQFNDPADFEKYPVTIERDITLLDSVNTGILFLPAVPEIYPEPAGAEKKQYDLGYLETVLEGTYRPGHFQGVCQVVHRLLEIVKPDDLYMGQKDYQQCMVIRRLLQLTGMESFVHLHIVPTRREENGLAMSSRNMRLSAAAREKASLIYRALTGIKEQLKPGNVTDIADRARQMLAENGFAPDYVAIAADGTLELVDHWDGQQPLVALAAAYTEGVRLIDNLPLTQA
ncbi:MAG TPA: pantoate--beta-alanine ligase [Chitinophagaceae bacterium]|nr:pantoate--beta-alanine ligase [Chitinophagaceae bacterium]